MAAKPPPPPEILAAHWEVVEAPSVPGLVGELVRIERQQPNPSVWFYAITPVKLGTGDERFQGIFSKAKPRVVNLIGDKLLCSCGILAKRKT
jgi:hypothetical protein